MQNGIVVLPLLNCWITMSTLTATRPFLCLVTGIKEMSTRLFDQTQHRRLAQEWTTIIHTLATCLPESFLPAVVTRTTTEYTFFLCHRQMMITNPSLRQRRNRQRGKATMEIFKNLKILQLPKINLNNKVRLRFDCRRSSIINTTCKCSFLL